MTGEINTVDRPTPGRGLTDHAAAHRSPPHSAREWLSIVGSAAPKLTTESVEIAGHTIPAGETVVCALPSADRDPSPIDDPDRLDPAR